MPKNPPTFSDRILLKVNNLEDWIRRTRSQHSLPPVRLGGCGLLIALLLLSNVYALLRWPIAWVSDKLRLGSQSPTQPLPPAQPQLPVRPGEQTDDPLQLLISVCWGELQKLLDRERLVLVDFWAPWCGPCVMMSDVLRRLGRDTEAMCQLAKVNTMKQGSVAKSYRVKGYPR